MKIIENEVEKTLRKVWFDGWERGKKQAKTPYDYTLGDERFLKKEWEKLLRILRRNIKEISNKTIAEAGRK